MPFNVLLLPLLGGYFFISSWNYTRFDTTRYSGEGLLFHSATAGMIFLIFAFGLTSSVIHYWPESTKLWQRLVPFDYSGTSFLAFLFGVSLWAPLNMLKTFKREDRALKTLECANDFLEMLLARAQAELKPVSVVLKSRKVYIGFVTGSFDPANSRKYIQLLPLQSGYRDSRTLQLTITTDYSRVYDRIISQELPLDVNTDDFVVVVPITGIVSINLFDEKAYGLFNTATAEGFPA